MLYFVAILWAKAIVQLFSLEYPSLIDSIIIAGSGAKLKVHQDIFIRWNTKRFELCQGVGLL